jgi:hypothetical protein
MNITEFYKIASSPMLERLKERAAKRPVVAPKLKNPLFKPSVGATSVKNVKPYKVTLKK